MFPFVIIFATFAAANYPGLVLADEDLEKRVVTRVKEVNSLREALVGGVTKGPDAKLFKAVCGPVGVRIKQLNSTEQIAIRQASHKNRNPKNQATDFEMEAIKKFRGDQKLMEFWISKDGSQHFFHRITVRKKCLACHGERDKRPEFVKSKYPEDKAFGFQVGDLRGVYHVQLPQESGSKK